MGSMVLQIVARTERHTQTRLQQKDLAAVVKHTGSHSSPADVVNFHSEFSQDLTVRPCYFTK